MADPLFVVDLDTLKQKLRLTGIVADSDADLVFQEALLTVRRGFYDRLGLTAIATIEAITFTEDPDTDDEYRRLLANVVEVKWVRLQCLKTMPVVFMDGSGDTLEQWNKEAAFRQGPMPEKEWKRLEQDLEDALVLLAGGKQNSTWGFSTIEPYCRTPTVGGAIWARYRATWSQETL